MTPEIWAKVRTLFEAALELDYEARSRFVAEQCAEDSSVRIEVERLLLQAEDHSRHFLEQPPVPLPSLLKKLTEKVTSFEDEQIVAGRFRIVRMLGRGGMGEVYQAEDLALGGELAIKTIRPEIASNPEAVARFRREMQAGRSVTHPNVCRVFDLASGTSAAGSQITFLTMEMLHGENLDALIHRDAPLPPERALLVVSQIASALDAAHAAGIVHRDLKPSNVMLVQIARDNNLSPAAEKPAPRVVVTDFGLSRLERSPSNPDPSPKTDTLIGTPNYMAPEQLDDRPITPATDVFAFGLVTYEILTSGFPFPRASTFAEALNRFQAASTPATVDVPSLPAVWQNFLRKCLELNPKDRFQNGAQLLAALSAIADGTAVAARRVDSRPRQRVVGAVIFSSIVALMLLGAFWLVRRPNPAGGQSIAVLPFRNRLNDSQLAYLSHGITETLIQDLSRIPPHRVLSQAAVASYEKNPADPLQAGRDLHVDRVLAGSVSRIDDELLIDAELIDVGSGKQVWGHSYRKRLTSLSATLEEFSTEVTDALRLQLSGPQKERLSRQYAVDSDSYRDYLNGRFEMSKRTPESLDSALRLFDQVISRDPGYAPAWASEARIYGLMAFYGARGAGQEPLEALRKSQASAVHALDLDSTLAEAWSSLAYVQMQADYNWAEAEKNFHRALELDSNEPDVHDNYALELTALGRFDEAIREIKTARRLAPDSLVFRGAQAVFLHHARRYEDAVQILLPIQGRFANPSTISYHLARNYWAEAQNDQALAVLERVPPSSPLDTRIPLLAAALAKAGQRDKAEKLRDDYASRPGARSWYYMALADLALGRKAEALTDLDRAWQQRADAVMLLGVDPLLDPLRGDPKFRSLLKLVNLSAVPNR